LFSYPSVAVLIGVALAGLGLVFLMARVMTPHSRPVEVLPFRSGWRPAANPGRCRIQP
jgi:hypothetical protein